MRSPTVECEHEGQAEVLDDSSLLNNAQRNGHNAKLAWILPKFSISDGYATNRGKQPITFHQLVKISPPPSPTLALSFVLYDSGASKLGQIPIKLRQNAGICLDLPVVWAQGDGFREGFEAGREKNFQTGFDLGYKLGFQLCHDMALQATKKQINEKAVAAYKPPADNCVICSMNNEDKMMQLPLEDIVEKQRLSFVHS
ncbi:unnamed protein product [Nezara viridula]|uniref:Essential protein Yae1 N-terminal domain-containing protein n=1 Tax=Nezara viridula TaxID=85310 RepID=A0A9P0MQ89_NEZVI|nr:unnamed protein product [Nezara viridula]